MLRFDSTSKPHANNFLFLKNTKVANQDTKKEFSVVDGWDGVRSYPLDCLQLLEHLFLLQKSSCNREAPFVLFPCGHCRLRMGGGGVRACPDVLEHFFPRPNG